MNSYYHAEASARKWGGTANDYIEIHSFIDSSKRLIGDVRHRSMYHHTEGIFLCETIFGRTITVGGERVEPELPCDREGCLVYHDHVPQKIRRSIPREVPVRLIAELHIMQDLGWIPSPKDYIDNMELKQWMGGTVRSEKSINAIFPKQVYLDKPVHQPPQEETNSDDFFNSFFNTRLNRQDRSLITEDSGKEYDDK